VGVGGASPVSFNYTIGQNSPPSQTLSVFTYPAGITVTASPVVTTPPGRNWLSATINAGTLTVSTNPAGLAASSTAYTGYVMLSVPGASGLSVPVTLTVYPPLTCTITGDQVASVADVQRMINAALGVDPPVNDLNQDGTIGVVDVQIVINAVLGSGCVL
jgi:hypothetical protein